MKFMTAHLVADATARALSSIVVTPEMRLHSRITYILYFVDTFATMAILLFFLTGGIAARLQRLSERWSRKRFAGDLLYFVLFLFLLSLIRFPLEWIDGWLVPHHFNLSSQSFLSWLGDELKGLAVAAVIGALFAAGALAAIRRAPRRWWLICWLGFIPVAILLVVLQPLVLDPIFNDFKPLQDVAMRNAILNEAEAAGLHGADLSEVDKSKQTHEMNAYVNGIGPTARIVVWDTLLQKMTRDEVLFVVGHEIGHNRLHHVRQGLLFGIGYAFVVLFIGSRIALWGVNRFGKRWEVASLGDGAALPWLVLLAVSILFLSSPVLSAFSRSQEHAADVFALKLTGLREAGASSFVKFALDSKVDPDPPALLVFWTWSHPPLAERVQFCLDWPTDKPSR
jgi:STE24 endopeptidase